MKLFAPRANWDMKSPESWWPLIGSVQSSSGVRVTPDSATSFAAVFAATRVISETLASLPCSIMERQDYRTSRKATEHPSYVLLHDQPNPEQDIFAWMDMQTAFQLNWGNAYAEKQRDSSGKLLALWPIHPSRIPVSNIMRNARDPKGWGQIEVGQPGEIVYNISNDDGTRTPIPASDMLHVPGVLSTNGVTGQSIITKGANTIGIGIATEEHAGAFFRNGAVQNMALKHPKTLGKETAERLREQWQRTFAGVKNHYKTLVLEDGMEAVMFSFAPEAAQLIEARKFSVNDVARLYREPPHMLADLERQTHSNIEQQSIDFIIYTMLPWIIRWEKALNRQLLTQEEKNRFYFHFNTNALLRGDSAARSEFYKTMTGIGAFSPNMVLELEDMNPVEGGDQHFVPANNLMPLDKMEEYADAQIKKLTQPTAAPHSPAPDNEGQPDTNGETNNRIADLIAKVEMRDTSEVERLAIRERENLEMRDSLCNALRESIAARMRGLTDYEIRAVKQATDKPGSFPDWHDLFYAEFGAKVRDALEPFEQPANRLGFPFSSMEHAYQYVRDSQHALAPLPSVPCNELADKANNIVSGWSSRPSKIASAIVPKGVPCEA